MGGDIYGNRKEKNMEPEPYGGPDYDGGLCGPVNPAFLYGLLSCGGLSERGGRAGGEGWRRAQKIDKNFWGHLTTPQEETVEYSNAYELFDAMKSRLFLQENMHGVYIF